MAGFKNFAYRRAFDALYFSGLSRLLRPFTSGVGLILTLHHVRPARHDQFQPNKFLEITPEFLETIVLCLQRDNVDLVSIGEAQRRLTEMDYKRRFAVLTLDDGYRDTKDYAYPILKKHDVPFAMYVATSFPDRRGKLWWTAMESIVAANDTIAITIDGTDRRLSCRSPTEKYATYLRLRGLLAARTSEAEMLALVQTMAARYGVDMEAICAALCMTWDDIAGMARDSLVTIGAHTVNHVLLGRETETTVRAELKNSREVLEGKLGRPVRHFAYPFGDVRAAGPREYAIAAESGFDTAVTTRPSVLTAEHRKQLTALPRITVSGEFQRERDLDVLLSGAATAIWNGLRRSQIN
jgi:peptidoglycan/xylan/chitin deacetylase (PgdA/CDA1 family)